MVALVLELRNGRSITLLPNSTLGLGWAILGIRSVGLVLVLQALRMEIWFGCDVWDLDAKDLSCEVGPLGLFPRC